MTIASSSNYDLQSLGTVLKQVVDQINTDVFPGEEDPKLLSSVNYDEQGLKATMKAAAEAANGFYDGDDVLVSSDYDDTFLPEMLQRLVDKVNLGAAP